MPHSEICGSKCVCSLPAAYRKLLRPSSPVIAKASTMCTYSLVPITLAPATKQGAFIGIRSTTLLRLLIHTIITHRITFYSDTTHKNLLTSSRLLKNIQHLISKRPNLNPGALISTDLRLNFWWRMTGSNRRPPACKAGALPAELIPLGYFQTTETGRAGWTRTNDPRVINTVL